MHGMGTDLLVRNASLYSSAGTRPDLDILCRGGRIFGIADAGAFDSTIDGSITELDARGRTIIPSLIDSHQHLQKAALIRNFVIDFLEIRPRSVKDVLAAVRRTSELKKPGEWVRGDSLDHQGLAEGRFPTRDELDSISPENPVVVIGRGNHAIAANSIALAMAGIDDRTEDPAGGRLDRFEDGTLTGVLWELGKLRLDPNRPDTVLPVFDLVDRMKALENAKGYLFENGITSVHDIVMDPVEVRAYMALEREGRMPFRVQLFLRGVESKIPLESILDTGFEQGFGSDFLRMGGVKLSIDGAESSYGAALYEPYPNDSQNYGLIRIEQKELDSVVSRCHLAGVRTAVHAIGDRAVDMALEAFEKAFAKHGRGEVRHRIEHAYFAPRAEQIQRISKAELIVSTQPAFIWYAEAEYGSVGGPKESMFPLRSMLDSGIRVIANSDFPCVSANPWHGIGSAVARLDRHGNSHGFAEAVSVHEALGMYTEAPAFSAYEENLKGAIKPGMLADLVVLDRDPMATPREELADTRADATILNGEVVFTRDIDN